MASIAKAHCEVKICVEEQGSSLIEQKTGFELKFLKHFYRSLICNAAVYSGRDNKSFKLCHIYFAE